MINQKGDEVQRENCFNYHVICFTTILEKAGRRCYMNVTADFRKHLKSHRGNFKNVTEIIPSGI